MAYAFFIFRAKKPLTLESTLVFSIRKNLSISVFESREKKTLQINDSYPPKSHLLNDFSEHKSHFKARLVVFMHR